MYGRLNEATNAKQEGERALAAFRAIGYAAGEAQALMCLTNVLRLGNPENQVEASRNAQAALKIFQDLGYEYSLARAEYYIALAAEAHASPAEIANLYERSLATARKAGNVVLEPILLMNAGGWYEELGSRSRAVDYYERSREISERFGDDLRAAQVQANAGAILIEYAGKSAEGLRDVENARRVFQKLDDKDFEIFAAKVTAVSYRYAGRYVDAERELNRGLALANARDIRDKVPALTIDLGLVRFELGDYPAARDLLVGALGDGSGKYSVDAHLQLGLVHARLGAFQAAHDQLSVASRDIERRGDVGRFPVLYAALGELAYEAHRWGEARTQFAKAAALWTDGLPDPASVQARAYSGLLDALEGRAARGRPAVQTSLAQAQRMGLFALEVRCRLILARIDVGDGRFQDALNDLRPIKTGGERALGSESEALVRYWRSRALKGGGDISASQAEADVARKLISSLLESVPAANRSAFASRPDIGVIVN
jgi:tetratricopeptide (TPR) repeat protein